MQHRPIIKQTLSTTDKLLEISGYAILTASWIWIILNWSILPETIPTHFNASGKPDAWGSKFTLIFLPVISTIIYVSLTILNRFPHIFNYPVQITEKNAAKQYANATRLIRYLKLIVVLIFTFLQIQTTQVSIGKDSGIGFWFFPLTLTVIFIPLIFFIIRSTRIKP